MRWERLLKILLTSNGLYINEIKQQFFQLIVYEVVRKKATVITTASPQKQNNKFAIKARENLLGKGLKL